MTGNQIENLQIHLPAPLQSAVDATRKDWQANDKVARLWKGDTSLWSGDDENKWLGWLRITEEQIAALPQLTALRDDAAGFKHALLLGMGGSSLCPEVLKIT